MSSRPFLKLRVQELEKIFAEEKTDIKTVNSLFKELTFRKTPKAKALKRKVVSILALNAIATGKNENRSANEKRK